MLVCVYMGLHHYMDGIFLEVKMDRYTLANMDTITVRVISHL